MKFRPISILCFAAMLASSAAPAQQAAATPATSSSSPVAFVYVINSPTNSIVGYAANSAGKLTSLPQFPYDFNLVTMAANGKYFFGGTYPKNHINTYTIATNGSLKYIQTTSATGSPCGAYVILDHTGSDLYASFTTAGECAFDYNGFESFSVEKSTGKLKYIGTTAATQRFPNTLSILGNNRYAYGTECLEDDGDEYFDTFAGYRRQSNGALTNASITAPTPSTGNSGTYYCRAGIASDPTNHLAVAMQQIDTSTGNVVGSQLGTYTADENGNLTTASTAKNMPTTAVGNVTALAMSPSGKLLAVGGTGGVQVFHFNGASPITHYTGPLIAGFIYDVRWDNANHLYAVGYNSSNVGKLYVYTVTPTSVSQAPGSPYSIANPIVVFVQNLTK